MIEGVHHHIPHPGDLLADMRDEFSNQRLEKEGAVMPTTKGTILVADDEEILRVLWKEFLEGRGYTVVAVSDAVALRNAIAEHDDVVGIISDNMMPPDRMKGIDVFEFIYDNPRCEHITKRVLISAVEPEDARTLQQRAEAAGAVFFTKPVNPQAIGEIFS